MKKDTEMIVHRFDDDIAIYPISDVHLGAAEHMAEAWDSFCKNVLTQKDTYLILNGDLINNSTRSSVVNSVSWMAYGGYAAQKMLLPSDTGIPQKIEIKRNIKKLTVTW